MTIDIPDSRESKRFSTLTLGDVFKPYVNSSDRYMVIETVTEADTKFTYNGVNLDDGTVTHFDSDEEVFLCSGRYFEE